MTFTELTAAEVKAKLDRAEDFQFIDVREPHEYQIASIPGAVLIPLGQLPNRLSEIDPSREVVLHCKMGGRSAKACELLVASGYRQVRNMQGGITAWSDMVDPKVPKY